MNIDDAFLSKCICAGEHSYVDEWRVWILDVCLELLGDCADQLVVEIHRSCWSGASIIP